MDSLTYETLPAPPPLDRVVHCFWFLRGTSDGAVQPVVPDGRAEIVVHLGEPFAQLDTAGQARRQETMLVSGQLTGAITLAPSREVDVVGIRFRTASARTVLGLALHELTDAVASLNDVAPRLGRALAHHLRPETTSRERVAQLARVFGDLETRPAEPSIVATARVLEQPEPHDLRRLARSLGTSTRTLERRCLNEIGVRPGLLRRIVRFRRAFQRLERTPAGRWARLAAASGYYDQAHMIRDFKQFTGAAPSTFFGRAAALATAFLSGEELSLSYKTTRA
jgi:AraC-like DNA-binding protein